MPNVKVHVEEQLWNKKGVKIKALLPNLREVIMTEFSAPQSVCHLVILPCVGLEDQAEILVDIHYLAMPGRTSELATTAAENVRKLFDNKIGHRTDVRAISLAGATYIALH